MGQAAGTAAALMAAGGAAAHDVVKPLQQHLRSDGVDLGMDVLRSPMQMRTQQS
jgi:hypothetical protein